MNTKKKLLPIYILKILHKYSAENHKLTQSEIISYLQNEYDLIVERKAVSRNLSILEQSGYDIITTKNGTYLNEREFTTSELQLLIDGVMSSRYINEPHSCELVEKLSKLSNKYFIPHIKNIYALKDFSKTDNLELFLNIEIIDEAIDQEKQISVTYNKYGLDKKMHPSSTMILNPYQFILHNQRYFLMAYNEKYHNMGFYRLDHITNTAILNKRRTDIHSIPGYTHGINYKDLSQSRPYMFSDKTVQVCFLTEEWMVDQIIDWFGKEIQIQKKEDKIYVTLNVSPKAMEYWAMQYASFIDVIAPQSLRNKIKNNLKDALNKYEEV